MKLKLSDFNYDLPKELVAKYPNKDRDLARKKGDYKLADIIRKELESKGVIIEDKNNKTIWKYK